MKKKFSILIGMALVTLSVCAGCNKETPTQTPTPTGAEVQTIVPTKEPDTIIEKVVPSLVQIVKESKEEGENYTGKALVNCTRESVLAKWGEPDGMLSGLWGDVWVVPEESYRVIVYYDAEGIVSAVKAGVWETAEETKTPAPTELPQADPTPTPTEAPTPVPTLTPTAVPTITSEVTLAPPRIIEADFAMVSPVPQNQVADISGTMTKETYPVVDGSTATLPLSEAVFMAATGESAEVAAQEVMHTKTTNSYHRLYNDEVDLLIVYEPAETIVERMKTEPLCIKPIGLDALVFLANTANPLESLTMEQLVEIYSGKVTNWAEVGGLEKELLAFQRPVGSGSQTLMQKLVMGDVEMVSGDNVFRYNTMSDILEGMLSYNNEDNTLGYSVFYYANNMYFEKDLKLVGVDGVLPSTRTIYDGSYGLTNAFYAVIRPDEPEDSNARKIFDWLTGEDGQQLVLDLGYVPVQMPAGADISDVKAEQQEKLEILAKEPLEEGQYFVFLNPQNTVSEFYYGDMTVYNHNWEEVANFYNVTLNHGVGGVYTNRYLPIGQIRQNTEGEQVDRYGVYDLEQGEYSVVPSFTCMEMLDMERGYYAVPKSDGDWMDCMIINGAGEIMLENARMEDWLMMWKFGNGYQEMRYDYENWENGCTYCFYDENLKLTHVYCETAAAIPDDENRKEGVEYYLMDNGGCLVDADGNIILNWAVFLDRFGDGEDMNCSLQLRGPELAEEGVIYPVLYKNKVYLLDSRLNLIRTVENPSMVTAFENADYYENYCYYFDEDRQEWLSCYYEGAPLMTSYGLAPDYMDKVWGKDAYIMYRRVDNQLFVEEYTENGDLLKYTITLTEDVQNFEFYYTEEGYVILSEHCGEMMQSPYYEEEMLVPRYIVSLLYQGNRIGIEHGMGGGGLYALDEEFLIWNVQNGKRLTVPTESIFEGFLYSYPLSHYTIFEGTQAVYELEDAYLISQGNGAVFLLSGNYIYAVGYDGEVYIRALHTFMSTD